MPTRTTKSGKKIHYAYSQAGRMKYKKARDAAKRRAKKSGVK